MSGAERSLGSDLAGGTEEFKTMPIPTNEDEQKRLAEKLAKLKVNGVSDDNLKTIAALTQMEWDQLQDTELYKEAFDKAKATAEVLPVEVDISIKSLEKQALTATMRNISSGLCSPEFVLDALKYATKVRQEERKMEQERKTAFTANTQIVINLSDVLKKAIEAQPIRERIIDFDNESKSVTNGLDTDRLMQAALGYNPVNKEQRPKGREQLLQYATPSATPSAMSNDTTDNKEPKEPHGEPKEEQHSIVYPPAYVNSYNPSINNPVPRPKPSYRADDIVITDAMLNDIDGTEGGAEGGTEPSGADEVLMRTFTDEEN